MTRALLRFELASFWHAGTGRGAGTELDALSHRTAAGLPVLPGRTVRGLLREGLRAAVSLGAVDDASLDERLFGSALEPAAGEDDVVGHFERTRFDTVAGTLVFGSARIGRTLTEADAWERWAATGTGRAHVEHLFRTFASTKLDEHGVAQDKTLRAVELVVPLTLVAEVTTTSTTTAGGSWASPLGVAARFVRGIGSHRNRGLGRVTTTLEVLS